MIENFFAFWGRPVLAMVAGLEKFGKFLIFHIVLLPSYFSSPLRVKEIAKQIVTIGYESGGVIVLTSIFLGLVQAIQMYQGFHKFGAETMMGYTIMYSIGREIGPVFAALMVTSRAISAMAAELGAMRVTEQIDAIDTLGIDSKKYLIVPRIVATTLSLPILIAIFDLVANVSAYGISVLALGLNPTAYLDTITQYLEFADFFSGIFKGAVFGLLIGAIGAYIGYFTHGGARGVGESTTKAVVLASITILVADYFLDALFLFADI